MMQKAIIVPLDGSAFAERAIPVARALAPQLNAHMSFMTVGDNEPETAGACRHPYSRRIPRD